MTDLTERICAFLKAEGADLVGVAPVSRWDKAPARVTPQAHMPEAKSVIAFAVHHPDASVELAGIPTSNYMGPFQIGQTSKLESLAYRGAKFLEREGYEAIANTATRFWWHRKFKELDSIHTASFSNRHAAAAAGLGEFGWNNLFMSPEYGPRQRVSAIITSAELEPTPLYRGPELCDRCDACVRACPGDSFNKELLEPGYDVVEMEDRIFKYAKLNRWRCIWGEQFMLPCTQIPEHVDEEVCMKACREIPRAGLTAGACLRACMSRQRRSPKKGRTVFRRKKDYIPCEITESRLLYDTLRQKAVSRAAELRAVPLSEVADIPVNVPKEYPWDDVLDEFNTILLLRFPRTPRIKELGNSAIIKSAEERISRELNKRGSNLRWEIAAFLDNLGYEAMCSWDDLKPMLLANII